jgi:TPR repeat protein
MGIKKAIIAAVFALASTGAMAQNFDDGVVAFIQGDSATALKIWEPLANNGDKEAQYHLGYMFQTGTGVIKDNQKALFWYNKAAKNGHGKAFILAKVVEREMKH